MSNNVELISPIKNMYHCSFESINFRYDFKQAYTSGFVVCFDRMGLNPSVLFYPRVQERFPRERVKNSSEIRYF